MLQTTFGISDMGIGGLGGASRSGDNSAGNDGLFADALNDQQNQLMRTDQGATSAQESNRSHESDAGQEPSTGTAKEVTSKTKDEPAPAEAGEEKTSEKQDVDSDSVRQTKKSDDATKGERTAKEGGTKKSKAEKQAAGTKGEKARQSAEIELTRQIAAGKDGTKNHSSTKEAAAPLQGDSAARAQVENEKRTKAEAEEKKDGKELPVALPLPVEAGLSKRTTAPGQHGKAAAAKGHVAQSVLGTTQAQAEGDGKELSQKILEQIKGSVAQSAGDATAGKASGGDGAKGATDFLRTLQVITPKDGAQAGPQPTVTGMSPTQGQPGTTVTSAANMTLLTPVGQIDWDKGLGDRLVWMVKGGVQEAKLQLSPRHLGPIDIKVSINHDQASVSFAAHNPHTREALEAAMPRLRDMLNDQGLNLAQSDVSQHQAGQQQHAHDGGFGGGHGGSGGDVFGGGFGEELPEGAVAGDTTVGLGALDYYA